MGTRNRLFGLVVTGVVMTMWMVFPGFTLAEDESTSGGEPNVAVPISSNMPDGNVPQVATATNEESNIVPTILEELSESSEVENDEEADIKEDEPVAEEAEPVSFELTDADPPALLRDYLAELLVLFERDARRAILLNDPTFDEQRLKVTVRTANVDQERSDLLREVKAVTYHELDIRAIPGGHEATIIVDI